MFKLVRYVAVGTFVLLPAATLQAQSGHSVGGTAYSNAPGAAWLPSHTQSTSAVSVADTALMICTPPIAAKPKVKHHHHVVHHVTGAVHHRTVSTGVVHHRRTVAKAAPPKVNGPERPRFMCPVIRTGPTIIGTPVVADLGSDYEVPMPGTIQAEDDSPMGLVSSTENVDFSAPQFVGENHRSFLPFMWVVGGGAAGAGLFSMFLHGNHEPPPPPDSFTPPTDPNIPPITTAPEPSSLLLLGSGLAGLVGVARRRRK